MLSRSSWSIGRITGTAWPSRQRARLARPAISRRCGSRRSARAARRRSRPRCSSSAGGDLLGRPASSRALLALAAEGSLGASSSSSLVVLVLAGDRVLELAHPAAELPPEPGQPLGAEDEQHDHQHDRQLEWSDGRHGRTAYRRRWPVRRRSWPARPHRRHVVRSAHLLASSGVQELGARTPMPHSDAAPIPTPDAPADRHPRSPSAAALRPHDRDRLPGRSRDSASPHRRLGQREAAWPRSRAT